MPQRQLVSFDWAIKRLLRSKANFGILEGFLSELLHDDIKILEILDGESNQHRKESKFNRVDIRSATNTRRSSLSRFSLSSCLSKNGTTCSGSCSEPPK